MLTTFTLLALVLSSPRLQELPDGASLTKQAEAAAKKFHTLQYAADMTMDMSLMGRPTKLTMETSAAIASPGKMRIASKIQGGDTLLVSDGEYTWMYISMVKQYTKTAAALGLEAAITGSLGFKMPDMASVPKRIKTLREETIEMDGQKRECWVIETQIDEISLPLPQGVKVEAKATGVAVTSWIDKKTLLDLQSTTSLTINTGPMKIEMHQKTVKRELKVDEPIADSVFTFTPPADAKEVKELTFAGAGLPKADLTGKDAPGFELKGVDAKPYSLAAFKGKPVLLDFWATWCGPCKKSSPVVEKIYKEYGNQGLVVLGINSGEDAKTVETFLKKTPMGYPAVLGGESRILEDYQVNAFPTFVLIGPDGKVAAYEVGFGGEAALRAIMEKAGLKAPAQK
jgi:thiol-disulfide isomerase/thioredoxin